MQVAPSWRPNKVMPIATSRAGPDVVHVFQMFNDAINI